MLLLLTSIALGRCFIEGSSETDIVAHVHGTARVWTCLAGQHWGVRLCRYNQDVVRSGYVCIVQCSLNTKTESRGDMGDGEKKIVWNAVVVSQISYPCAGR